VASRATCIASWLSIVIVMLSLLPTLPAQGGTSDRYREHIQWLSRPAVPLGLLVDATSVSPCAPAPDGTTVTAHITLTDPAGRTKEYKTYADSNWVIGNIIVPAANIDPWMPGPSMPGTTGLMPIVLI
jgi:hypothetical protein